MGDIKKKKVIGNLGDPKLPYDYSTRPYGTVPEDTTRPRFQWVSEVAYKNKYRIVSRGYDTTELMEAGYGLVDMLFVDFQARIPLVEEEQMLNYIMILALEDGLSMPAMLSRIVARSKTFLTQACGASILGFWPRLRCLFSVWKYVDRWSRRSGRRSEIHGRGCHGTRARRIE